MLRYVVLHHTGIASPHFDVMIERSPGGPLRTWRCAQWPPLGPTPLEALLDHRSAYLTFEGEMTGGRGQVRRVAAGDTRDREVFDLGIACVIESSAGWQLWAKKDAVDLSESTAPREGGE